MMSAFSKSKHAGSGRRTSKQTHLRLCGRRPLATVLASLLLVPPAVEAITVPTTPDVSGRVDGNNDYPNVVRFVMETPDGPGTICTATIINPRTVLVARHCVGFSDLETQLAKGDKYGIRTGVTEKDASDPIWASDIVEPDGAFRLVPATDKDGNPVLDPATGKPLMREDLKHDLVLVALEKPLDVERTDLLLSPLTGKHRATLVGAGLSGAEPNLQRASALVEKIRELLRPVDGDADKLSPEDRKKYDDLDQQISSLLVSDRKRRVGKNTIHLGFDPVGFTNLQAYLADWDNPGCDNAKDPYPDDCTPGGEDSTAPGDSGGPLFVDIDGQRLQVAVVTGGDQNLPTYGGIMIWTALFNYADFIAQNSPYKYVGAIEGDGKWSDPNHWVQLLDPSFYRINKDGKVENGIPVAKVVDRNGNRIGTDYGHCGLLTGAGATGFVPNNTDGAHGVAMKNCAQYFEVILNQAGVTTADVGVTIDKLKLDHRRAGLTIDKGTQFNSLLSVDVNAGVLDVNGALTTRRLRNMGALTGSGLITAKEIFNSGLLAPGGGGKVGELGINGNLSLLSTSMLGIDILNGKTDLLRVSGDVLLNGTLVLNFGDRGPRYRDSGTFLRYGNGLGRFSDVKGLTGVLFARLDYGADSAGFRIDAASFNSILPADALDNDRAAGALFDAARGADYDAMEDVFAVLDRLENDALKRALRSSAPSNAMTSAMAGLAMSERLSHVVNSRAQARASGAGVLDSRTPPSGPSRSLDKDKAAMQDMFNIFAANLSDIEMPEGWSMFARLDYIDGEINAAFAGTREQMDGYNLTFGVDNAVSDNAMLGGLVSFQSAKGYLAKYAQKNSSNGIVLAGYGAVYLGAVDVNAYMAVGRRDVDLTRKLAVGSLTQTLLGETSVDEALAGVSAGRSWAIGARGEIRPFVGFDYANLQIGGYQEAGGSGALTVKERSLHSARVSLGANYSMRLFNTRAPVRFSLGARGVRELTDEADNLMVTSAVAPSTYQIFSGVVRDRFWGEINAGLDIETGGNWAGRLGVTSTVGRDDFDYVALEGRVQLRF